MRNRELALCALLATSVVLGGCGGGGGGDKSTTSHSKLQLIGGDSSGAASPSKNQFLSEANQICLAGNVDISKAAEEATRNQRGPTIARLVKFGKNRALPLLQNELNQVKSLRAPAGDRARIKASIDQAQSALNEMKANPVLFASLDPTGPFSPTNRPAKRYGLAPCGSPP